MPWFAANPRRRADAEFAQFLPQRVDLPWLQSGRDIGRPAIGRGHIVVDGGHRAIGPAHLAAGQPQPLKCLRRGHLVHQLQVDVEQRGLTFGRNYHVLLPYLFKERFGFGTHSLVPHSSVDRACGFLFCGQQRTRLLTFLFNPTYAPPLGLDCSSAHEQCFYCFSDLGAHIFR